MIKEFKLNLRATKVFFLLRFVVSFLIAVIYLFVAANIQYFFVNLMGESTFNYIVGGLLSLFLGVLACRYLGLVLFMVVRAWHMAALTRSRSIIKKGMPAFEVGMRVLKAHFTSFAAVYGVGFMIKKASSLVVENFLELLEDVPYLSDLKKFSRNPLVVRVVGDLFSTVFDALIFYIAKYTDPGIGDDSEVLCEALRKYLKALPQIIIASLSLFLLTYVVPKVIALIIVFGVFVKQGIVAGLLITVIMFPGFYVLTHTIFEPIETVLLISGFSKYCRKVDRQTQQEVNEESNPVLSQVVDAILEEMGLVEVDHSEETEPEDENSLQDGDASGADIADSPLVEEEAPRREARPMSRSRRMPPPPPPSVPVEYSGRRAPVRQARQPFTGGRSSDEIIDIGEDVTSDSPVGGSVSPRDSAPVDIRRTRAGSLSSLNELMSRYSQGGPSGFPESGDTGDSEADGTEETIPAPMPRRRMSRSSFESQPRRTGFGGSGVQDFFEDAEDVSPGTDTDKEEDDHLPVESLAGLADALRDALEQSYEEMLGGGPLDDDD